VVSEALFEKVDYGNVPTGAGWYVLNARDAVWFDKKGCGFELRSNVGAISIRSV
jgi:hypothetical protein